MKYSVKYPVLAFSLLLLLLATGCRETPTEEEARAVMAGYLAERHLAIVSLEIGEITGGSMNTKVYMGSPSYSVAIKSITLEATQDVFAPVPLMKGQRITYSNVRVKVREKRGQQGKWELSVLSGMPVL